MYFGNTDKIYGLSGYLSFPKLEELQAMVELWTQWYACVMGEWSQGVTDSLTRWDFWRSHFHWGRTFLSYDRMWDLCYTYLPIAYGQGQMTHQGAAWQNYNPLTQYPDQCSQNNLLANCDGSELMIDHLFNPQGLDFYMNLS